VIFNTISFSLLCSQGVISKSDDEDENGKSNHIKTYGGLAVCQKLFKHFTGMNSSSVPKV